MIEKKFILNADGFGISKEQNQGVLEGYVNGYLTSASLCANTEAFDNAVNDILPDCTNLSIGVHLNLTKGSPLTNCTLLVDKNGKFNKNFFTLLLNQKNKLILEEIENEFRAQIEKTAKNCKITHIDSYMHIHAIPNIFEITCKLANEYNIKYVRTHNEKLYTTSKFDKQLNIKYPQNLLKLAVLKYFTKQNQETINKYNLKTNDYILGIGYDGMMDPDTIESGLKQINTESLTECIIHPIKYKNSLTNLNSREFLITQNATLKYLINRLGFDIVNSENFE